MAFVRTLNSPFWKLVLSSMASGNRPSVGSLEVCASTLGLLGAVGSFSTSHLGAPPLWVIVTVQPGGAAPGWAESKLKISAAPIAGISSAMHTLMEVLHTLNIERIR